MAIVRFKAIFFQLGSLCGSNGSSGPSNPTMTAEPSCVHVLGFLARCSETSTAPRGICSLLGSPSSTGHCVSGAETKLEAVVI